MNEKNPNEEKEFLNFLSEHFDPNKALNCSIDSIELPCLNAKLFNNLDEYAQKSFPKNKLDTKDQEKKEILLKQAEIRKQMKEKFIPIETNYNWKPPKTILTFIEENEDKFLTKLNSFLNKRIKLFLRRRKKTNHPCEQYSYLYGQLLFYDKHWNLILSDVQETVNILNSKKDNSESDTNEESNNSESDKEDETDSNNSKIDSTDNVEIFQRERQFNKLFIRGDNIIYISKV